MCNQENKLTLQNELTPHTTKNQSFCRNVTLTLELPVPPQFYKDRIKRKAEVCSYLIIIIILSALFGGFIVSEALF
jgi:hypothetical protein